MEAVDREEESWLQKLTEECIKIIQSIQPYENTNSSEQDHILNGCLSILQTIQENNFNIKR